MAEVERKIKETRTIVQELTYMVSHSFAELKAEIERSTSVKQAAVQLLKELHDKLEDIAQHPTPEEVRRLAQEVAQHSQELATAIAKHASGGGGEEEEEEGEGVTPAGKRK